MKAFLKHRSRRWGYDGWALKVKGAPRALDWTTSTTRREARELRLEVERLDIAGSALRELEVVKVRVSVEVVE
jgi:hypothetical protein